MSRHARRPSIAYCATWAAAPPRVPVVGGERTLQSSLFLAASAIQRAASSWQPSTRAHRWSVEAGRTRVRCLGASHETLPSWRTRLTPPSVSSSDALLIDATLSSLSHEFVASMGGRCMSHGRVLPSLRVLPSHRGSTVHDGSWGWACQEYQLQRSMRYSCRPFMSTHLQDSCAMMLAMREPQNGGPVLYVVRESDSACCVT